MLNLLISPQAEKDLEIIYEYTYETFGIDQADKYQDELFLGFQQIVKNRDLGVKYNYSNFEYRRLTINKHLIFYRIDKAKILITRVLHERMDIDENL